MICARTLRRSLVGFATLAFLAAVGSARMQVTLGTGFELRDGETRDVATQFDATANPQNRRAWIAQGRVRAALRFSDRARMFAEDETFSSVASPRREQVIAVEYDDTNGWLYTLTESALYVEAIGSSGTPITSPPVFVPFTSAGGITLQAGEAVIDLKLWPADQRAFVLTTRRLIVIGGTPTTNLTIQSWTHELAPVSGTPPVALSDTQTGTASLNTLDVRNYARLKIAIDKGTQRLMAYVTADMRGYAGAPNCIDARPFPRMLLVADVDAPAYVNPTFDADSSSGGVRFVFWNPISCPASAGCPCAGHPFNEYGIWDFDMAISSTRTRAFLASGPAHQITWLDLTSSWQNGIVFKNDFPILAPGIDALKMRVDPQNPTRFFTADLEDFYCVDVSSGHAMTQQLFKISYSVGPMYAAGPLDTALVQATGTSGTILEAWTVGVGAPAYIGHVVDCTAAPTLIADVFSQYHSDGGVASPPDAIYLPSFGGVARYKNSGTNGAWIQTAYQPAELPPSNPNWTPGSGPTEQITLAKSVTGSGDDRIFTASALGGFDEFRINATTKDPRQVTRIAAPTPASIFPTWQPGDIIYGNDVEFVSIGGSPYVITDLTDKPSNTSLPSTAALIAYKITSPNVWTAFNSVTSLIPPGEQTDAIHVTHDLGDGHAFVVFNSGFFVVDLGLLVGGSSSSWVLQMSFGPRTVWSIATTLDRMFMCTDGSTGGEIDVYHWNTSTGVVDLAPTQVVNGPTSFAGGLRARFDVRDALHGCGYLYTAMNNGSILEFAQPNSGGVWGNLTESGIWQGDYTNYMQDCRPYLFSGVPEVLAVKDGETFALVNPSGQVGICPP